MSANKQHRVSHIKPLASLALVSGGLCLLNKLEEKKNHITLCLLSFSQLAVVSLYGDVNNTLN